MNFEDNELVLSFSFTCKFRILHPNFVFFDYRSHGYATQKSLHYGTKAENLGSKQKLKTSSMNSNTSYQHKK